MESVVQCDASTWNSANAQSVQPGVAFSYLREHGAHDEASEASQEREQVIDGLLAYENIRVLHSPSVDWKTQILYKILTLKMGLHKQVETHELSTNS